MIHKLRASVVLASALLVALSAAAATPVAAQASERATASRRAKLPSPERIIADYHRALGGKKRVAGVRDATYVWRVTDEGGTPPVADAGSLLMRVRTKRASASRLDVESDGRAVAATVRSAWRRDAAGSLYTLTDAQASVAKLQAALFASRLVDLKKQGILARTIGIDDTPGEPAYVVEFSTRDGARSRAWFGTASKLWLRIENEERGTVLRFGDYRVPAAGGATLEPHRVEVLLAGDAAPTKPVTVLTLDRVAYNSGIDDAAFDPPAGEQVNVPELLREVARNQQILDERVSEYTFLRKSTRLTINDRGETTKRESETHEVYPVRGGGRVIKLVSENDVPLAGERLAREERRVAKEIEETEAENNRRAERKKRGEQVAARSGESGLGKDGDDELGVGTFLRACEFVSPRRERFRDRDAVVFDFRPRPGFKPANRGESLLGKLTGIIWIDPEDKQVMRLEARLSDGFKVGGGLLASVRQGSAFAFEQARMPDGVWLPRFSQINAGVKVFLLAGLRLDATREYSDYKRFATESQDYELKEGKQ